MSSAGLLLLYGLLGVVGGLLTFKNRTQLTSKFTKKHTWHAQRTALLWFIFCNIIVCTVAITMTFHHETTWCLLALAILGLSARIVNGQILFGSNSWTHYLLWIVWFAAVILLNHAYP